MFSSCAVLQSLQLREILTSMASADGDEPWGVSAGGSSSVDRVRASEVARLVTKVLSSPSGPGSVKLSPLMLGVAWSGASAGTSAEASEELPLCCAEPC